jgi:biopolymer transport protein ExbB
MIRQTFPFFIATRRCLFLMALIAASFVFLPMEALAQAATEEAGPPAKTWLQKWVTDGGIWMAPLGICSVLAIAFTVLCVMTLNKAKFCPPALKGQLMDLMQQCRVRSAIEAASQNPSFLGRMMTVALPHFDATNEENLGKEAVEDAMAEFAATEMKPYQKWVGYFSVLAQICPMLGLFGTVVGMVGAFEVLSSQKTTNPSQLAGDIQVALLTTFAGLFVAIPALALFYIFRNKLNDLIAETIQSGVALVDACVHTVHGEAKAARIPEGLS